MKRMIFFLVVYHKVDFFFASCSSGGIYRIYEIKYPEDEIDTTSSTGEIVIKNPNTAKVLGLKDIPKEHSGTVRQRRNTFQSEKQESIQLDKPQLVKENQELNVKIVQLQTQLKQFNDIQTQLKAAAVSIREQASLVDKYKTELENQGALVGALQKHLAHEKEEKLKYYKAQKLLVDQIPDSPQELNDLETTLKTLLQKVEKKKIEVANRPPSTVLQTPNAKLSIEINDLQRESTVPITKETTHGSIVKEITPRPKEVKDVPFELPKSITHKEVPSILPKEGEAVHLKIPESTPKVHIETKLHNSSESTIHAKETFSE